ASTARHPIFQLTRAGLCAVIKAGFGRRETVPGAGGVITANAARSLRRLCILIFGRTFRNTKKLIQLRSRTRTVLRFVFSVPWIKARPTCILSGCSNTELTVFLCSAFSALCVHRKAGKKAGWFWKTP